MGPLEQGDKDGELRVYIDGCETTRSREANVDERNK